MTLNDLSKVCNGHCPLKIKDSQTGFTIMQNALSSKNIEKFGKLEVFDLHTEIVADGGFARSRFVCFARKNEYAKIKEQEVEE